MKPQNFPEKLIWFYITWNYLIYFCGAQYVLSPIMCWSLLGYLIIKWWRQNQDTLACEQIHISPTHWIWILGILLIGLTHFIGSIEFNVEPYIITRDFFNGWVRMWALFAIFPLIGTLNIRPQIIFRAVSIFCVQSAIFVALFWFISVLSGGHEFSYISPLYKFGGQLNYYTVVIGNALDIEERRLYMIAPWGPALGMLASIYFFMVLRETNKFLRFAALIGSVAMILSSFSRTAIVCIPLIFIFVQTTTRILQPLTQFIWSQIIFWSALFFDQASNLLYDTVSGFKQYRSGSTRAREELNQLALTAWRNEAPIWGHGSYFEKSSGLSGSRNFVSDNTISGILYGNGLIGAVSLGAIFIWTFFELFRKIKRSPQAKVGIEILSVIFIFLGTENIQATAYLYWPGLIMLGIAFKETQESEIKHYKLDIPVQRQESVSSKVM